MRSISAPLTGTIVSVAAVGEVVTEGEPVAVLESMKMEYAVAVDETLQITQAHVAPGDGSMLGSGLFRAWLSIHRPKRPKTRL